MITRANHRPLQLTVRGLLAAWVLSTTVGLAWAQADLVGTVVLAVGEAQMDGQPAKAGASVRAGERLSTGPTGYLHIKTVDNGFLILRPKSVLRVADYRVDAQNPAQNRIRIELDQGVARSVTGEAVKGARQSFRFNTPLAAIGVRGTDFTVFTDHLSTQIQVAAGGVAVSGFGGACRPEGLGPCEGANTRELFAGQSGQLLQIDRGQLIPQVLRNSNSTPNLIAPPRSDEPPARAGEIRGGGPDVNLLPLKMAGLENAEVISAPIKWGRWQAVADLPVADLGKITADYSIIGINAFYALLQRRDAIWQAPSGAGVVGFALQNSQAVVTQAGSVTLAGIENGRLSVDFNRGSFATEFDLLTQGERFARQAGGGLGTDGRFSNASQFLGGNNMVVQGGLANLPNGGLGAAYLFQSRLDGHRVAYGATFWAK